MSSTVQATSSTSSTPNAQLITKALATYSKITGIDPSEVPFAAALKEANSTEAILKLLREREEAFKDHREKYRRLISCLSPVVDVIQTFSNVLGGVASLVSHPLSCHLVTLM